MNAAPTQPRFEFSPLATERKTIVPSDVQKTKSMHQLVHASNFKNSLLQLKYIRKRKQNQHGNIQEYNNLKPIESK